MAELPGDPYGIEIKPFGNATALIVHGIPLPSCNKVMDLSPVDLDRIPEILACYRQRSISFRFDMCPYDSTEEIESTLTRHGFHEAEWQSTVYGRPGPRLEEAPAGIAVRTLKPHQVEMFARLYGWAYYEGQVSHPGLARFRSDGIVARYERPGWHFYIAFADGVPAGGAALFIDGVVATLAGAATQDRFRGRGIQTALLRHRIKDAAELGAEIVVSRCAMGSKSERNLRRAELRLAYHKSVWEPRPFG